MLLNWFIKYVWPKVLIEYSDMNLRESLIRYDSRYIMFTKFMKPYEIRVEYKYYVHYFCGIDGCVWGMLFLFEDSYPRFTSYGFEVCEGFFGENTDRFLKFYLKEIYHGR